MKKKYVLFCIFMLLVCSWIVKSCGNRTVQKRPQQVHPNSTNGVLHVETVPKAETTVAGADREPVAERRIFPPQWKLSREVEHAMTKGARARATLRVVDSTGKCVPNARVRLNFMFFERKDNFETGLTDANGLFSAEKDTMSQCNWFIEKEGYYNTEGRHSFAANLTNDSVKNGRWQPWNPTLEVVLKEKRKPIPMYQNLIESVLPAGTNRLGFDFLIGDWVAPHGKGRIADMWYVYDENFVDRDNFYIMLSFVFPGENNGCYMRKMDNYSGFISEHEASDTEFAPSKICVIEQEKGKYTKESRFAQDDYMVFRIRTKTDDQGKIVSSRYGKIYGPVGVPHRWSKKFSFTYYLNPNPNDRGLEYNPQKNLIPGGQRHAMNRNLP